ncbi:hypothetical protein MPL1_11083 [Methylophaga lonarensis MPL]|uniref:Copper resistance protein D domain-containing protein n=1 Tax=Methylophaga lonarensis MPL TaxID=1286106 RepID=M7NYJ5_9GAMM|nr:DUF4149 domain-containing protein [Methylophaga lonarensis]EMR12292.1 hypothetical protein MPL1_11083 [Methylophaga lonarensis MPL]
MSIAIALHVLAAVIWVGGMFFAYHCLRPVAATQLPPEHRLPLWSMVFKRFFPWVWVSIAVLLVTGTMMIVGLGGMAMAGHHVHLMLVIGIVMMLLFAHVFFNPYQKLRWAVREHDWITGADALNKIRFVFRINLALGLFVVLIGAGGRYLI